MKIKNRIIHAILILMGFRVEFKNIYLHKETKTHFWTDSNDAPDNYIFSGQGIIAEKY